MAEQSGLDRSVPNWLKWLGSIAGIIVALIVVLQLMVAAPIANLRTEIQAARSDLLESMHSGFDSLRTSSENADRDIRARTDSINETLTAVREAMAELKGQTGYMVLHSALPTDADHVELTGNTEVTGSIAGARFISSARHVVQSAEKLQQANFSWEEIKIILGIDENVFQFLKDYFYNVPALNEPE